MSAVGLHAVSKTFGDDRAAVRDLSLEVRDGELLVVVGPSGCGKSTTLRLIAGLDRPSSGTVSIGGEDVTARPPRDRDVAMVFQTFALYPHLSVAENLAFPLKLAKVDEAERRRRVGEMAELVELTDELDRRPRELSGGQVQRVAIGRALIRRPAVLLMDEPLSNLDGRLRLHLRREIVRIQREVGTTTLHVTHDQDEALTMGDRIAVLDDGRLHQVGSVEEVHDHPADLTVARLIGLPAMNLLPDGDEVVGVRPDDLRFASEPWGAWRRGVVTHVERPGTHALVTVRTEDGDLVVRCRPDDAPAPGLEVGVEVIGARLHRFDATSGQRIE